MKYSKDEWEWLRTIIKMEKEGIIVDGRVWKIQPSFFDGCFDLVCEDETISFLNSATLLEITDFLRIVDFSEEEKI